MTLRDVGAWFADLWRSITDGLNVALTESFLDWPLWLSIPAVIAVLVAVIWFIAAVADDLRTGKPEPLGWTLAFGVLTTLCALATYDLWISRTIFDEGESRWLQVAYPIMTTFFGVGFISNVVKGVRR